MKIEKLANLIEEFAPLSLQEEWDNSGFQIKAKSEVSRVLVALELTSQVIDEAIEQKCDMILTHHPLFFEGIKLIDYGTVKGGFINRLIDEDISVYSSHTPFDICDGGNNDYIGKLIGAKDIMFIPGDEDKICRMSWVDSAKMNDFIDLLADKLQMDKKYFNFTGDINATVNKVGWCTGAGSEFITLAKAAGCDTFITGDLKYHQAIEAKELGLNVIDCGHYGTEHIFIENMADKLKGADIEIIKSKVDANPFNLF